MQNVLVIAITRLGDLIQTEPFLRAVKSSGRASHVTLLVERNFVEIANQLVGADEVIAIDFTKVLGSLDRSRAELPIRDYIGLANELLSRNFDEVWNLTHTRPAMVLTSLIGGRRVQGVALDSAGLQIVRNEWLTYFFATNLARPWSAFNLVDIYVNAVQTETPFADRLPQLQGVTRNEKRLPQDVGVMHVLLHPGASQSDKQWPVERFVGIARLLLDRGAKVTLIGGGKERQLAESFPNHRNLSSRIGSTTISDLIEICNEADLLISADSGPVHVAAACNTPVIAIEGGSAHGYETAPYNTKSIVLQPHLERLLTRIPGKHQASGSALNVSEEMVVSAIETMIGERPAPIAADNVAVYQTQSDEGIPGLSLQRLSGGPAGYDEQIAALKCFWFAALSEGNQRPSCTLEPALESKFKECARLTERVGQSRGNWQRIEEAAKSLMAAEQSLRTAINGQPHLDHLDMFLQIARSSVSGDNPYSQAGELAALYKRMTQTSSGGADSQIVNKRYKTNSEIEVTA
jgi:ADP-heptose:LPS heptosyltransferase